MRRHAVVLGRGALALPAFAQTTPPPVIPGTVTAEAVEVVRVKPDQAKVYVTAASRNADAVTASDEAGEQAKKFADTVTRASSAVSPTAELVEGELVRTVRVRVVYAVSK